MKYSRDLSRKQLNDPSFDKVIDEQVKDIAEIGATHVAIGTPYDEEFFPILTRWVEAARKYGLNVWFRGNFSGWEKWFGYDRIGREEHLSKTEAFIRNHPNLFEDGDVFTSCPECENGGPGDPRKTRDISGHRAFLVKEYEVSQQAFSSIGKDVNPQFFSMNADVARLIMDRPTTQALGGVVTIDHYVATPDQLISDIKDMAQRSGGRIVLGEFGVPIPDIHGRMSDAQQADWIDAALGNLAKTPEVIGVNYWVNTGGSTELWRDRNSAKPAVKVVRSHFRPKILSGTVADENGRPIPGAKLTNGVKETQTNQVGTFTLPYLAAPFSISIEAEGYFSKQLVITSETSGSLTVKLSRIREESILQWFGAMLKRLGKFFNSLY